MQLLECATAQADLSFRYLYMRQVAFSDVASHMVGPRIAETSLQAYASAQSDQGIH